jgi:organic hydroperoxide reductase OsmC/OhrA
MNTTHHYQLINTWNGNRRKGTSHVSEYDRTHTIKIGDKPELHLTTDNPLYGDRSKLNPEDLLVAALSSCHMLSYLYLCAQAGVVVLAYTDNATGVMIEKISGGGSFKEVTLNPVVTVADNSMIEKAIALHHKAHEYCFIANSVNFEVKNSPVCNVA